MTKCHTIYKKLFYISIVTIARAVELKHQSNIIGGLAYECSKHFESAGIQQI